MHISIKDYHRNKNLKVLLLYAPFALRQFYVHINGVPQSKALFVIYSHRPVPFVRTRTPANGRKRRERKPDKPRTLVTAHQRGETEAGPVWEWDMLILTGMRFELVSLADGRTCNINPKEFGKLLHMARLNGWQPERVPNEWPSDSWETEIILPHLGPYMPGRVSRADAEGLRIALTRALATGDVAAEGTVQLASVNLLQVARAGAFRVCLVNSQAEEPQAFLGAVPA